MTLFTDEWALIGTIDPDQYAVASPNAATLGDAIDMSDYDQVAFILMTGNFARNVVTSPIGAQPTLDFKIVQATTSAGTYKDVTSASATQLTASPTDDDKQAIIIVNQNDLDMDNNYRYVKPSVTLGGSGDVDFAIHAFGRAKHRPASDSDLSSVDEIVNV